MRREFREEARIAVPPDAPLRLHGFFLNARAPRRDHIAVYVAPTFAVVGPKRPDREIAECAFFPLESLPPETTRATRARLDEIRAGRPPRKNGEPDKKKRRSHLQRPSEWCLERPPTASATAAPDGTRERV